MSTASANSLPLRTIALFALWLLFSQSYTAVHMAIGFGVALGVALLNSSELSRSIYRVSWIGLLVYAPWLFSRILASGVHLTYLILHPRLPLDPRIIRYRTQLTGDTALTIFGNSITLTPGTVTVEIDSDELEVHALDEASALDITSLRLEKKIADLFTRREGQ
jgi:multicomponent Na+:H+ antiporter subunit E